MAAPAASDAGAAIVLDGAGEQSAGEASSLPPPSALSRARAAGAPVSLTDSGASEYLRFAEARAPSIGRIGDRVYLLRSEGATDKDTYAFYFRPHVSSAGILSLRCRVGNFCAGVASYMVRGRGGEWTFPFSNALVHLKAYPGRPLLTLEDLPKSKADAKAAVSEIAGPDGELVCAKRPLDGRVVDVDGHLARLSMDVRKYRSIMLRAALMDGRPMASLDSLGARHVAEELMLPRYPETTARRHFQEEYDEMVLQPVTAAAAEYLRACVCVWKGKTLKISDCKKKASRRGARAAGGIH